MGLGERMQAARKAKGLRQEQLSEILGVGRTTISVWEHNKKMPGGKNLQCIADALGVSVDYLMGRDEQATKSDEQSKADEAERQEAMKKEAARWKIPDDAIYFDDDDFITIPILSREMTACLGHGISVSDITQGAEGKYKLEKARCHTYSDTERPFALYCEGSCLESIGLMDGFTVAINPVEDVPNGNLGAVSLNGTVSIKFISRRSNGTVLLSSDMGTESYTPREQEEYDFYVIGRVVEWKPPRHLPTKAF